MGAATTMTRDRLLKLTLAAVLSVALVGGVAVVVQQTFLRPNTITAYFTKTVAIYPVSKWARSTRSSPSAPRPG